MWNVLPDHVHLVIAAVDMVNLSNLIGKIKGYSAYAFYRQQRYEPRQTLWAQKFYRQRIQSESMLTEIMEYVRYNHQKHVEKWGEIIIATWKNHLKLIIESSCTPFDECSFSDQDQSDKS